MIKIPFTALYTDENTLYFNEDSINLVFICNGMCIRNIGLHDITLDNTNYNKDDPNTIILIRLSAWHIKFEKRKELKNMMK